MESRDKCAVDHVKKTAAYVRLILELLRESTKYKDIVTDEYIEGLFLEEQIDKEIGFFWIKNPDSFLLT